MITFGLVGIICALLLLSIIHHCYHVLTISIVNAGTTVIVIIAITISITIITIMTLVLFL